MEAQELIEIINNGEDSRHEFKSNVTNGLSLAQEMIALSNYKGGLILIGVNDEGDVQGLPIEEVRRLNEFVPNRASDIIRPSIRFDTENVRLPEGLVMVITVPEGTSKPYMDNNTSIFIRNGASKQKLRSREEIQRMFQSAGLVQADGVPVKGTTVADIDEGFFATFYQKVYGHSFKEQDIPLPQLLENMKLAKSGEIAYGGILLFGLNPQNWLPVFNVKAVAFPGIHIEDVNYLDSRDIDGNLADIFQKVLSFLLGNIRHVQNGQSVNSIGEPEIPRIVFEELVTNALVHRDYFVSAPVKVLVFADRVEIISPGHLPNNLTTENIKMGISNVRNPILHSFATRILPYRGLGSGIPRAIKAYPNLELKDDRARNTFSVIIKRKTYQ